MWRILAFVLFATTGLHAQTAADEDAVAIVVLMDGGVVATVDVSYPDTVTQVEINRDIGELAKWSGWRTGAPRTDLSGEITSVHIPMLQGGARSATAADAAWPIVAAYAPYRRLGIVIMGGTDRPVSGVFENQYVRMEQSGGDGVQSYQVFVRDEGFSDLRELRTPQSPRNERQRTPGKGLAWFLLFVGALATGFAAYMITRGLSARTRC